MSVFAFETIEYQPFVAGLNKFFLFEVLFYGVVLPASTGLALSWLAASRTELAWLTYFQNLQRNLRIQLNNAHSPNEVAKVLLEFGRVLMPLVGVSVFVYDQRAHQYDTVLTWALRDGSNNASSTFHCTAENCPLLNFSPEEDEVLFVPCRDPGIATMWSISPAFCMPFLLSGSPVAGFRLCLEFGRSPYPGQVRSLKEVAPMIAATFERARLEQSMTRQQDRLRAEQQRIARDVHDSLGHSLAYLRLKLDQITMELNQAETNKLRREVTAMRDIAKEAYDQMRNVLVALTPENGTNLNITLLNYAEKIRQQANFRLELKHNGIPRTLPALTERHIFYIYQEALTNIEKHAHAKQVDVDLSWSESCLEITISDDGVGYDTANTLPAGHFGLENMHERALDAGGQLNISSRPGRGTQIILRIPYGSPS